MLGLGAFNVLYVPLLENELGLEPVLFGAVEGVEAVAIAVSGALLAAFSSRVRLAGIVVVAMAVLGVSVVMVAVVKGVWLLLVLMFANGLTQIPINSSLSAMVQANVSDEVRGRVAAGAVDHEHLRVVLPEIVEQRLHRPLIESLEWPQPNLDRHGSS